MVNASEMFVEKWKAQRERRQERKKEGEVKGMKKGGKKERRMDGRGRKKEMISTSPSNCFLSPWNSQVHYIYIQDLV